MITRTSGDMFANLGELHRRLEQLFASPASATSIRSVAPGSFPAVNVGSNEQALEICILVPGVDPKSLDVTIDKGVLSIAGERKPPFEGEDGQRRAVFAQERPFGRFRRAVALPDDVDPERVDADYRNGVLLVKIQKSEASRPRRITVA